jgi:hypothetical protein
MDILRCKTLQMVRKEIWAHMLVYNVVRSVMAQAAAVAQQRADEVSFTGALQTINAFLAEIRAVQTPAQAAMLWEVLLWAISEHRVGNAPTATNRVRSRGDRRTIHGSRYQGQRRVGVCASAQSESGKSVRHYVSAIPISRRGPP